MGNCYAIKTVLRQSGNSTSRNYMTREVLENINYLDPEETEDGTLIEEFELAVNKLKRRKA